jgi:hypothetical protein
MGYIQRWPLDYDGVIANEPALNYTGTRLSNVAVSRALYDKGAVGWLSLDEDAAGAEAPRWTPATSSTARPTAS